jgi:hypothetical protein
VLHTADLGLIRSLFPIGGPDMYVPGILAQMDRLSQLDFYHYVPSHFGQGTKADFLEAVEFQRQLHRLSLEAVEKLGPPRTGDDYRQAFRYVYEPLRKKYSHYHGFEQQILFAIGRSVSGALLGY